MNLYTSIGNLMYGALAAIALWGAFCVVMVWYRVREKRFRTEDEQTEFLEALDEPLLQGDFEAASEMLEGDKRATSQLALLAIINRDLGYSRVRQLLVDRFQRDVLADLEHRLSWVNTCIKTAPMLGLLGTVMGMKGAFGTLSTQESVKPQQLAGDISFALLTTIWGLSIAIPLILAMASVNVRIRKMEDLVAAGLSRFLEVFRIAIGGPDAGRGR
ncbi:MAG: MotA/TolQ/ExbB proton channel family protein [Planctomycetaceae bacterium]|nr:MotA/TolQ/ExbB proton channel family protein [Planctomycetaceae bacterium]